MISAGQDKLREVAQKMMAELSGGTKPAGEQVTVRAFIGWFGYERRGAWMVTLIRSTLAELGLRTVPDFAGQYIDGSISIELDMDAPDIQRKPVDPTVRIRVLSNAHSQPTGVRPNDPLAKATTIMLIKDFSQLPVMINEREIKGMVTWRSIGTTFALGRESTEVRHCMEEHREIAIDAPFFDALNDIREHGYVLVRNTDQTISGIVTASDFATQFAQLAQPFLIIGEIELQLRNLASQFTLEEITEVADDPKRPISGTADLNFGAYCRLLENPKRWKKLKLAVDRNTFMEHLGRARQIRNDVMHFAPDGLDPDDVQELERIAMFLRKLAYRFGR